MDAALLAARLLLSAVFAVAAVAKLLDLPGSRRAVADFGVPKRLVGPAGLALPMVELAVAGLLVPSTTAWWGAIGALVLLLAFIGAIGWNLARGRTPDCHCFGQIHSAPAGRPTLVRNGVMAAIAAFVVAVGFRDAGASPVGWLNDLSRDGAVGLAAVIVAVGLLATQGWVLAQLVSHNGRLLLRLDALEAALAEGRPMTAASDAAVREPAGLPVGTQAPNFALPNLAGETVSLDGLRTEGKPVLLVFSDPGCRPCGALMPEVGRWQRELGAAMTIAVVASGSAETNRAKAAEHGLGLVLLQAGREVSLAYAAGGTPAAVLVRPDGTVGSPIAGGVDAVRTLVARAAGVFGPATAGGAPARSAPAMPVSLPIGAQAPVVALPDLDGGTVALSDSAGEPTVVLFWNPACGFCRRMLEGLRAWEAAAPIGAPRLLVVSTGSVEENRAMGLKSEVVLDQGFSTGRSFGASGTPSAVLVDAAGKIASQVVSGAEAVGTLLAPVPQQPVSAERSAARQAAPVLWMQQAPRPS